MASLILDNWWLLSCFIIPSSISGTNCGPLYIHPVYSWINDAPEQILSQADSGLLIPYCDYAAINVSSPNTEGLRKLQDPILLK